MKPHCMKLEKSKLHPRDMYIDVITSAIAEINPYYNNQDQPIKSHSHKKCCQTTNCDGNSQK